VEIEGGRRAWLLVDGNHGKPLHENGEKCEMSVFEGPSKSVC
jgi:hypothetical protein